MTNSSASRLNLRLLLQFEAILLDNERHIRRPVLVMCDADKYRPFTEAEIVESESVNDTLAFIEVS